VNLPDLNPILEQLALDPFVRGLQLIEARELATDSFPRLDTDRPALIFHLNTVEQLETIVRTLRVNYPAIHPVSLVKNNRVQNLTLDALVSDAKISRQTILYVPPLSRSSSPVTLANIMARLRAPVGGCPWDLEQTHESITRSLVEETYEVIEAISDGDIPHLQEELGDLYLHVLFQTQIARDQNEFALSDVGTELAAKLIRRHPHVFGDVEAHDAGTVISNWESIKQEEKKHKGQATNSNGLDAGIPRHLPALTRAQKISERGHRKKISPSSNALPTALKRSLEQKRGVVRERAFGQLLLELAALAEQHGIDAERALNAASKNFAQKNKG
jgi:tetrapyrrole methylase family protein / MazG family protein